MPPLYSFLARDRLGNPEKGTIEAQNSDEAVTILQAKDLLVISIEEETTRPISMGRKQRFHGKVRQTDLSVFARSLSAMIEAGLPLLRALELVEEQTRSRRLGTVLKEIIRDIRGGSTFRDAVAKHSNVFSPFWVSLIEMGEASGQLTKALDQVGLHLEKAGVVRRRVISALIYPVILILVAIVAMLIFTLKIIPMFAQLFSSFGATLPALTRAVITVSDFFRHNFLILVAGIIGLWLLFVSYLKTPIGRWQFDKMTLRLPVVGPLVQGVHAERFASDLSTLLKAGVPILHALEIVIAGCQNKVIAALLEHVRVAVREGRSLAEPLSRTDLFPPMVAQMIAVGEQTGKLSIMLGEVAKFYEEQVTTAVERMTALLEPIMLVGMGLVIGTLVISMYLPIFQLSQTVRG